MEVYFTVFARHSSKYEKSKHKNVLCAQNAGIVYKYMETVTSTVTCRKTDDGICCATFKM